MMKASGDAVFEARLSEAIGRGIVDIRGGRYVTSVDEAFARARALAKKRADSKSLEFSPKFREK